MFVDYFYWQYIWAPRWFVRFFFNVHHALFKFFSVELMVRTLASHWHKDVIRYRGGTPSKLAMAFTWNQVSRLIGFIIRSAVLLTWLAIEVTMIPLALTTILLFLVWPWLVLAAFAIGFALITV